MYDNLIRQLTKDTYKGRALWYPINHKGATKWMTIVDKSQRTSPITVLLWKTAVSIETDILIGKKVVNFDNQQLSMPLAKAIVGQLDDQPQ